MSPELRGSRDDFDPGLLTPSLQGGQAAQPIFSTRAGFWVAFIGGLYPSALFQIVNLVRMRRLGRDLWICLAGALVWTALLLAYADPLARPELAPGWLQDFGVGRAIRISGSGLGLLLFGALYLRQRTLYAAQRLTSDEPPNPWPFGAASCVCGWLVQTLVLMLGKTS